MRTHLEVLRSLVQAKNYTRDDVWFMASAFNSCRTFLWDGRPKRNPETFNDVLICATLNRMDRRGFIVEHAYLCCVEVVEYMLGGYKTVDEYLCSITTGYTVRDAQIFRLLWLAELSKDLWCIHDEMMRSE